MNLAETSRRGRVTFQERVYISTESRRPDAAKSSLMQPRNPGMRLDLGIGDHRLSSDFFG